MNKEQALKEWQYGTQTPTEPCNDYAPDTLATEPADREICTTCFHHKTDHMNTPDIITRLTAAACMLNDYEQHNDCPEEVFGDRTAADACDDAAAIIKYLVATLEEIKEWTMDDESEVIQHGNPTLDDGDVFICSETLNERFHTIREAINKATK